MIFTHVYTHMLSPFPSFPHYKISQNISKFWIGWKTEKKHWHHFEKERDLPVQDLKEVVWFWQQIWRVSHMAPHFGHSRAPASPSNIQHSHSDPGTSLSQLKLMWSRVHMETLCRGAADSSGNCARVYWGALITCVDAPSEFNWHSLPVSRKGTEQCGMLNCSCSLFFPSRLLRKDQFGRVQGLIV